MYPLPTFANRFLSALLHPATLPFLLLLATNMATTAQEKPINQVIPQEGQQAELWTNNLYLDDQINKHTAFVLRRMALENDLKLHEVYLQMGYMVALEETEGKFEYLLRVYRPRVTKPRQYKGFDVSYYLRPSEYKLFWQNKDFFKGSVPHGLLMNGDTGLVLFSTTKQMKQAYLEKLLQIKPEHTQDDVQDFEWITGLVDEYNETSTLLETYLASMRMIRVDQEDQMLENRKKIDNAEQFIQTIGTSAFYRELHLNDKDPKNFLKLYKSFSDLTYALDSELDRLMKEVPESYVDRGVDSLINDNPLAARKLFEKATQINPDFGKAYVQLAQLDYREGHLVEATSMLKNVMLSMSLDQGAYHMAKHTAQKLQEKLIETAQHFMENGYPQVALHYLETARSICTIAQAVQCGEGLGLALQEAHQDKFDRYLQQGQQGLSSDYFGLTSLYLERGTNYVSYHGKYLKDTSKLAQMQTQLQKALVESKLAVTQNYLKKDKFQEAYELLGSLPSKSVDPSLRTKVQQGYTKSLTAYAEKNMELGNYSRARLQIGQVAELDPTVLEQFGKLKLSCEKAQEEYDKYFREGRVHKSQGNLTAAFEAYRKAKSALRFADGCEAHSSSVEQEMGQIKHLIAYYDNMGKSDKAIARKGYWEGLSHFLQARAIYLEHLEQEGLPKPTAEQWAIKHKDVHLANRMILYLAEMNQSEDALRIAQYYLNGREEKEKDLKESLKKLGKQLAVERFMGNEQQEPSEYIDKIAPQSEENLEVLRTAFLKTFEDLQEAKAKSLSN